MTSDEVTPVVALMGQIMSANAAMAEHTANQLLEYEAGLVRELCEGLVEIDRVLTQATVIDRKTEAALRRCDGHFARAAYLLQDRGWNR